MILFELRSYSGKNICDFIKYVEGSRHDSLKGIGLYCYGETETNLRYLERRRGILKISHCLRSDNREFN
jgi:hypothetical protein